MTIRRRYLIVAGLSMAALSLSACGPDKVGGLAAPAAHTQAEPEGAPASTPPAKAPGSVAKKAPLPQNPTSYVSSDSNSELGIYTDVPYGWTRVDAAAKADFRDASGQLLLRLDMRANEQQTSSSMPPRPDVYLRQLAARTAKDYPQYKLIGIGGTVPVAGTDLAKYPYAEWEFTFVKAGVTRHVIDAAIAGDNEGSSTAGEVYYSAPAAHFDDLDDAYGQALQRATFAG